MESGSGLSWVSTRAFLWPLATWISRSSLARAGRVARRGGGGFALSPPPGGPRPVAVGGGGEGGFFSLWGKDWKNPGVCSPRQPEGAKEAPGVPGEKRGAGLDRLPV